MSVEMNGSGVCLDFDLDLEEIPFKVKQKDGSYKHYVLRALDGRQRNAYLNEIHTKNLKDGHVIEFSGLQEAILTRAVFTSDDKPVTAEELASWGAGALDRLTIQAKGMSGLMAEAKKQEKEPDGRGQGVASPESVLQDTTTGPTKAGDKPGVPAVKQRAGRA